MNNTSIDNIFDKVFDRLKKLTPALVAILIASAILLFAPTEFISKINLSNLGDEFNRICGFVFLISSCIVASIMIFSFVDFVRRKIFILKMKQELPKLTISEKIIITLMYHLPAHSISLCVQEGITGALLKKQIVTYASTVSDNVGVFTFQFILQPWVVRYLDYHPDFYNMSEEEFRQQLEKHYKRIGR